MRISEASQSPDNISLRGRKRNDFTDVMAAYRMLPCRLKANEETHSVSARNLAAGLWKSTAAEAVITSAAGGGGIVENGWFDPLQLQDESSLPFSEFPLEGATKWDLVYRNISAGASRHLSCKKKSKNEEVSLNEEKTSWKRRERQKLHVIVDDLKNKLKRERQGRKRVQIANSQLLNDIVDAKSAVKEIMQNYEKERKTRELVEKTCHELAKKIEDEKIKMEVIKRKSLKLREQLEVERKMLQMADILREERVKIKMAEAKLILEEKYCQLNNLITDLEDFLRSKDKSLDMIEISEGEVIRQAVKSADIKEITDLLCSTIEDHQMNQVRSAENNESADHRCIQNGSETEGKSVQKSLSGYADDRKVTDRTFSATSVLTGHESLKSEVSDIFSPIIAKKIIKKPLTINWNLRSAERDSNVNEIITVKGGGRFGNRSKAPKMGRVTPADNVHLGNPHITRAMKGCLEWPQGMSKNGLKGKLLDSGYRVKRSKILVSYI